MISNMITMRRQLPPQADSFFKLIPTVIVSICCIVVTLATGCQQDSQQDSRANHRRQSNDPPSRIHQAADSTPLKMEETKLAVEVKSDQTIPEIAAQSLANNANLVKDTKPSVSVDSKEENGPTTIPNIDGLNPPPVVHYKGKRYTGGQLHKNNTLLILVYEGDIRAEMMLKKYLPFVEPAQAKQAKKLIWSYHEDFVRLRRQRAAILEHASDDKNVALQVFENRLAVADLVSEIRSKITNEVMTPEQSRVALETFRKERAFREQKLR